MFLSWRTTETLRTSHNQRNAQEMDPQIRTGAGQDLKSCRDGSMSGPPGLTCVLGRGGGKTRAGEAGFCRTPNRSDSLIRFLTAQKLMINYCRLTFSRLLRPQGAPLPQGSAEDLLKHLFSAQTNASESKQQSGSTCLLTRTDPNNWSRTSDRTKHGRQLFFGSSGTQSHLHHVCVKCVCVSVCINTKQIQGTSSRSRNIAVKPCFWHLSGPFCAKFSVVCFGLGLIFHSHLWTRLSVDYGRSYLLSPVDTGAPQGCVSSSNHIHASDSISNIRT